MVLDRPAAVRRHVTPATWVRGGVLSAVVFALPMLLVFGPFLVLVNPNLQPLSVRLPAIAAATDKGVLMAALAISTLIPIVLFLFFRRMLLRGAGLSGAVKG